MKNSNRNDECRQGPEDQKLSEQSQVRRVKLDQLRSKTAQPYPNNARPTAVADAVRAKIQAIGTVSAGTVSGGINEEHFTLAGRMMSFRLMGKSVFFDILDRSGRIQIYAKREELGEDVFADLKTYDLGDILEVSGKGFMTKSQEPSIHATSVRLLVKCLHPLPEKWHGLTDIETKYRQRYLDLMVSDESRKTFLTRAKIIREIRSFFDARDYIEVETPVMAPVASGASAKPFVTHHNALDLELHLRIALELPLKRLIVGGLERVYEIGRIFRNEGISTEHNPEFTMIEFYEAYATYETLMALTEELFIKLCDNVLGSRELFFREMKINFQTPWRRLEMTEAVHELAGVPRELDLLSYDGVKSAAKFLGCPEISGLGYGELLYELFDRYCESKIIQPTFITKFPREISPLARSSEDDPRFVDRFELMIAGMEVANAFSELNDPDDQDNRFRAQLERRVQGDEEAMAYDHDFITALQYGMPPTAGQGIGIDRLAMLFTEAASIRDVILFPTMKPLP